MLGFLMVRNVICTFASVINRCITFLNERKPMKLTLMRIAKKADYTIGKLMVNGTYLCDTMEPTWRDLSKEGKIWGKTAIPEGTYKVFVTKSRKFHRWLPLLWQVPGFEGIRIHWGNYPRDTQGCILVGWNKRRGMLNNSHAAVMLLMNELTAAYERNENVTIEIH